MKVDLGTYELKKTEWLEENYYNEGDVMEDENGEYVIDVKEDGTKTKIYLKEELREDYHG